MRSFFFLPLLFIFTVFAQGQSVTHSPYIPQNYNLVFNDEFDNPASKTAKWKPDNRDGRGPDWDNDTIALIKDGVLKLKHIKLPAPVSGRTYSAPTGSTISQFKYGYFECRYKYSAAKGINNSFWLLNAGSQLEKDYIEIDVNEGQLDPGPIRSQLTYTKLGAQPTWDHVRPLVLDHTHGLCNSPSYLWFDKDFSAEFHTYGFEWTPDSLLFYLDGVRILSRDNRRVYSTEKPYRLLNYPMSIYLSILGTPEAPLVNTGQDYLSSGMEVDYIRVYQLPGSTDGLPPTTGTNLIKNGGFGEYDLNDYGNSMYSWNSTLGNIDSTFLKIALTASRNSPVYMPSQNINLLPAGTFTLKFRARVTDKSGLNSAALKMKISNNDNISASSLTGLNAVSGGGGVSGTEVMIRSSMAPAFTTFTYRFVTAPPAATAKYTRVMFYLTNPDSSATFSLDDVEITPYTSDNSGAIVKDGTFDLAFKNTYAPTDLDEGWACYANYGTGKFVSSKITETNGNIFTRITTTAAGEDYHFALAQYSPAKVAPGKYKISLRAKALVPDSFLLKLSVKSALSTNLATNLSEATDGVSLKSNKLYFGASDTWKEYSAVFDMNHATAEILRINFLFHKIGTYDIDDVKIEPYSSSAFSQVELRTSVHGGKGVVFVSGLNEPVSVRIYTVSGTVVSQTTLSGNGTIAVPKGIYVVTLANSAGDISRTKTVVF